MRVLLDELLCLRARQPDVALLQQGRDVLPRNVPMRIELRLQLAKPLGSEPEVRLQ